MSLNPSTRVPDSSCSGVERRVVALLEQNGLPPHSSRELVRAFGGMLSDAELMQRAQAHVARIAQDVDVDSVASSSSSGVGATRRALEEPRQPPSVSPLTRSEWVTDFREVYGDDSPVEVPPVNESCRPPTPPPCTRDLPHPPPSGPSSAAETRTTPMADTAILNRPLPLPPQPLPKHHSHPVVDQLWEQFCVFLADLFSPAIYISTILGSFCSGDDAGGGGSTSTSTSEVDRQCTPVLTPSEQFVAGAALFLVLVHSYTQTRSSDEASTIFDAACNLISAVYPV